MKDTKHSLKKPTITEEAKLGVVNKACTKPNDHCYASEVWNYESLAKHVCKYAPEAGHNCLNQAVKAILYSGYKATTRFNLRKSSIIWNVVMKSLKKK